MGACASAGTKAEAFEVGGVFKDKSSMLDKISQRQAGSDKRSVQAKSNDRYFHVVCAAQNVEVKRVTLINKQRKKDARGEEFERAKPTCICPGVFKAKGMPMTRDVYCLKTEDDAGGAAADVRAADIMTAANGYWQVVEVAEHAPDCVGPAGQRIRKGAYTGAQIAKQARREQVRSGADADVPSKIEADAPAAETTQGGAGCSFMIDREAVDIKTEEAPATPTHTRKRVDARLNGDQGGSGKDDKQQWHGGGGVGVGESGMSVGGDTTNVQVNVQANVPTSQNSGGMLNAGLRNRYKVQAERESAVKAAAEAAATAAAAREAAEKEATLAPAATPTRKRKKKSSQKSSPEADEANTSFIQPASRPTERYSDLGGIGTLLRQIRELVEYPLSHPEVFTHLGVDPPRGVLLRGPPGCGKTHLADAVAGELGVSYFRVSAPEIVGGVSGESESRIRSLFEQAARSAPAIVFVDEIDAIAPKRSDGSGGRAMEKRIVAQLLTSLDALSPKNTRDGRPVMVLGATNRPDAIDPALRRAGRFDREIVLGAPNETARESILRVMTKRMRVDGSFDHKLLARKTPGFVGADIRSLTKEAAVSAINRIFQSSLLAPLNTDANTDQNGQPPSSAPAMDNDVQSVVPLESAQLEPLYVTMDDFLSAIPRVQPSSKREGFTTHPDVSWADVGALAEIREELTLSVLEPIAHPEKFRALGLPLPAGVLLYGPPGCGKTLLAKAIANESGANFISVKGPELLDKYVGESERSVRVVFERARSSSPCIIFFDELDSLCPRRGSDGGGGGGVTERVVNQLLTEMDGLDSRRSVFVIAATNRPELIDSAMLRPGRLDKLLYVPLPTRDDRFSILCALGKTIKLAPDVDLRAIADDSKADGFSGADCAALLREAGLAVLRDSVLNEQSKSISGTHPTTAAVDMDDTVSGDNGCGVPLQITTHHFKYAFDHVMPSVSKRDQARYDRIRDKMARARTRGEVNDKKDAEVNEAESTPSSPHSS